MSTTDAMTAHVRLEVLRDLPMMVVDLEGPEPEGPLTLEEGLFRTMTEHGLVVLPRFYGVDLPRGARVGVTLAEDECRVEDEDATKLLTMPVGSVDADWRSAAQRLRGTMLLVGRNLGVDPDLDLRGLCDLLEEQAAEGRVAGAIVGVAEPTTGLPLFG